MNKKEILKELAKSNLTGLGFSLITSDVENNLGFVKDCDSRLLRIGLPYSRNNFVFYNALTTICFKEIEKIYTDLCCEATIGKINTSFTDVQKKQHYLHHTTSIYIQVKTPNGVIKSEFNYLNISDLYPFTETGNIDLYMKYLNKYYIDCALPFFKSIPDIQALDKLTDDKDEFEIALYLSNFSELKKIILANLTNNPKKDEYFYNFKNVMDINYSIPTIPMQSKEQILANLSSLEKIKKYFDIR